MRTHAIDILLEQVSPNRDTSLSNFKFFFFMKFILIFNDVPRLFYLLTPFIIFLSFFLHRYPMRIN